MQRYFETLTQNIMVQWPGIIGHQSYGLSIDNCLTFAVKSNIKHLNYMFVQNRIKWISNICTLPVLMNCHSIRLNNIAIYRLFNEQLLLLSIKWKSIK